MDKVLALMEDIGRYLTLLKVTDFVDIAIIIFLVYKLLSLVKSTRAENILKGVAIFLLALGLSTALDLRAVKYILSHVVEWGILALIILFQPEIRQILERLGSKNLRLMRVFRSEEEITEVEKAIDQTVMACSEMSRTRTGVLMVFERNINLDDIVRTGRKLWISVYITFDKDIVSLSKFKIMQDQCIRVLAEKYPDFYFELLPDIEFTGIELADSPSESEDFTNPETDNNI